MTISNSVLFDIIVQNNLVFYGVKGDETDQDECEKIVKNIMTTHMQASQEYHDWPHLGLSRISWVMTTTCR
jgi:hypothetical protein